MPDFWTVCSSSSRSPEFNVVDEEEPASVAGVSDARLSQSASANEHKGAGIVKHGREDSV